MSKSTKVKKVAKETPISEIPPIEESVSEPMVETSIPEIKTMGVEESKEYVEVLHKKTEEKYNQPELELSE